MTKGEPLRASLILLATAAVTVPLLGAGLRAWAGPHVAASAVLGAGLATLSALGGIWLWSWAFDKSRAIFLGALAGGFLGRMLLFGAAVAILVLKSDFSPAAFVGGLFTYYVICQVVEIRAVSRLAAPAVVKT